MTLEDKTGETEHLKHEIEDLKKYFRKGLKNRLSEVYTALSVIRENPDEKEIISLARQSYSKFEHDVIDISEQEVKQNPELKPLYDIKPFKKKLRKDFEDFLEAPSKEKEDVLKQEIKKIIDLGDMYHNSIMSRVRKVRKSEPDYVFEIIDAKGNKFYYE